MQKKILILLFTFPLLFSCTSKEEKLQTQKEIKRNHLASENYDYLQRFLKDQDLKLDYFIENMPLEEKVAQMFIQNLEGYKSFINTETYFSITHNPRDIDRPLISGGYLFFSYNIAPDFQQEKAFINSIFFLNKTKQKTKHNIYNKSSQSLNSSSVSNDPIGIRIEKISAFDVFFDDDSLTL